MSLAPVMDWQLLPFDALSARQLHDLLQLRSAVFVVEQACVFQDIDGADPWPCTFGPEGRAVGSLCALLCARPEMRRGQHWAGDHGA